MMTSRRLKQKLLSRGVNLVNRRVDEMVQPLEAYKTDYSHKRNPEGVQKNWNFKIKPYPKELIEMFEKISISAEPYTAFGLETGFITKWNVENQEMPKWSMYSLCRNAGLDFQVLTIYPNEVYSVRTNMPPINHISNALWMYFGGEYHHFHDGVLLDFKKLAGHLKRLNSMLNDADIIADRYVNEYGIEADGTYDINTYHLSDKIPREGKDKKFSLDTLLGDSLD